MATASTGEEFPIVCPLSDRRTPQQLYIKLAIVHITVIFSLCHLIHVRRDYGIAIILILFIVVSPVTVAVQLVLPIPLLILQAIVVRGDLKLLQQSLAALIGEIPKDEISNADTENSADLELNSTSNSASNSTEPAATETTPETTSEATRLWQWKSSWKTLARSLPLLAILAQSITSVWLFSRRFQPSILYDHYVLQLAVVGMLASALSLMHLFLNPVFPEAQWILLDPKVKWLIAFRPTYRKHSESLVRLFWKTANSDALDIVDMIITLVQFSLIGVLTTSISQLSGLKVALGGYLVAEFGGKFPNTLIFLSHGVFRILPFAILLAATLLRKRLWQNRSMVLKGIGIIILAPVVLAAFPIFPGLLGDMAYFVSKSFLFNVTILLPANHEPWLAMDPPLCSSASFIDRIANINQFSLHCPCPGILQDPVADMVWALA